MFCETDVLAREVLQKSISALPCCMGSIFFVIRTQRGSTIFAFCDTSPARRRFFSFFRHLPSENQKNQQNRTSKLWFRRVGAEVAKSKSAANCHIAPSSTIGTRFSNRQKIDKSIQECVQYPRNINNYNLGAYMRALQISLKFIKIIPKYNEFQ